MALDKNNKNVFYLLGRYVAVVERSNGVEFNSTQMHNIQQATETLMRYDRNVSNYTEERMQIMSNLSADGFPKKVLEDEDGGRFWIGYYHQKATMPTEVVTHHTPTAVKAVESNEIKELEK